MNQKIKKETIKYLTKLSRIGCSEEEQEALLKDLNGIVQYVSQLQTIDTDHVAPCNHVLEEVENVMREDIVGATLPREAFLGNAPAHVGGMIRVPPVIKNYES